MNWRVRWQLWWWRLTLKLHPEAVALRIAQAMPRWLVYWCAIRLVAHATTGKWGNEEASSVTALDALDRWDK